MTRVLQNFAANLKRLLWSGFGDSYRESDSRTRVGFQSLKMLFILDICGGKGS